MCRELKCVETGKVLCSCPQCIADAVALTEEYLAEQGKSYEEILRYFYQNIEIGDCRSLF